jgi:membrane-bound serine protease (ClpP class)
MSQQWRNLGLLGLLCLASFTPGAAGKERATPPGNTIVVDISGEIDLGLAPYVERVLREAGPDDLVVLEVNTFGGRIDAAVQIRDALLQSRTKTVAFIHSRAISAGALISLATDTIVMTHGATIGAATPVQIEGGKMQPVEQKVVSYFRKEMKATAEAKGRRGDIAEAMVDASVEIPGLDGKETTLTLTTAEALKFGIAKWEVSSLGELFQKMGRPEPAVRRSGLNWAERLARFLSTGSVSSILMTLGMLGLLIELYAPGHAISALFGGACLGLFFFGHYVVHLAGLEELLLFGGGALLCVVELLFLPGHGALLVIGVVGIIASLGMSLVNMKHMPLEVGLSLGWVTHALGRVLSSLVMTAVGMWALSRVLPKTRLGRPLILEAAITATAKGDADVVEDSLLVGRTGRAETALRPAGKMNLNGRIIDVVSENGFLEIGAEVVVTAVDGTKVVVRKGGTTS